MVLSEIKSSFLKRNMGWFSLGIIYTILVFIWFWEFNYVIYPLLAIVLFFYLSRFKKIKTVRFRLVDIGVLILFVYEIINFLLSNYHPNSFSFLFRMSVMLLVYIIWIKMENRLGIGSYIMLAITFYGGVLALASLLKFVIFCIELKRYELIGIQHFKSLFGPFSTAINDWATIVWLFFVTSFYWTIILWKNKYLKYPLLLNSLVLFIATLLSFSRGIYISMFFFLIVIVLLTFWYGKIRLRNTLGPLLLVFFLVFVSLYPIRKSIVTTLKITETTSQKRSLNGRIGLWKRGFQLVKDHPSTGSGSGNFTLRYYGYERGQEESLVLTRVNNTPIQILIDKGFIGLGIYLFFIGVFLWVLLKLINKKSPSDWEEKVFAIVFSLGMFSFLIKELTFTSLLTNNGVLVLIVLWIAMIRKHSKVIIENDLNRKTWYAIIGCFLLYFGWLCQQNHFYKAAEIQNTKFVSAMDEHRFNQARSNINKAISLVPNHAVYHLNKGLLIMAGLEAPFTSIDIVERSVESFDQAEKWSKATEAFQKVLKINPEDSLAKYYLGWLSFYSGDINKTKDYFERACQNETYEPLYNLGKALLHYHLKEESQSILHFKKLLKISPNILEGQLWESLKKESINLVKTTEKQVVVDLEKASELSNSPIIAARLAKVYMHVGDSSKSRELFKKVISKIPNMNRPWLNLGDLNMNNDYEYRELMYKRAEFLDQSDYLPKLKLAKLYEDNLHYEEALFYYKRALPSIFNLRFGLTKEKTIKGYHSNITNQTCYPQDLIQFSLPHGNLKAYCYKMGVLYSKLNNDTLGRKFQELASKDQITMYEIANLFYGN